MASLAHALDLKCMLTNISMEFDQSMDSYLHSIKTIVDALAAIKSPISDLESIQLTTAGLLEDHDSFVTTFSMLPGSTSFDDLRSKLLLFEQRLKYKTERSPYIHQAFVATTGNRPGHAVVPVLGLLEITMGIVIIVTMGNAIGVISLAKVPPLRPPTLPWHLLTLVLQVMSCVL